MTKYEPVTVLTVNEAAEQLRKSPKQVRRYIHQKLLAATKPVGSNEWLIVAQSLRTYLNQGINQQ